VTVCLRYALYFAPAPDSAWARFGEAWLARTDSLLDHPRRYGFHATLKAPFRLRSDASIEQLVEELDAFARVQIAFSVPQMQLARLDDFLALVPASPEPRLDALAAHCVKRFDRWRAPLSAAELDRRRRESLTQRQEALLARWGYPHVLDEYRFHMSLTGLLLDAQPPEVPPLPAEPLRIDAVTVFEEQAPQAPLRAIHRAPFARRGRLVYVVGASGSGKDSVIDWARERLPADVVVARRTITRPEREYGEQHQPADDALFDAMLERGEFAMHWRANGHRYGIRREIDAGRTVIVNGSREYLPRAAAAYPQLEVVHVTAPAEVLRARLEERAREEADAIEARLARRPAVPPTALEISNAGAIERAGEPLLRFLAPRG
jgi:phosphonate metabolism protein PhnN/1,5-bisphosphokinase (PRPP-forming)